MLCRLFRSCLCCGRNNKSDFSVIQPPTSDIHPMIQHPTSDIHPIIQHPTPDIHKTSTTKPAKKLTIYTSTDDPAKKLKSATQVCPNASFPLVSNISLHQILLTLTPVDQSQLFESQTPIAWKVFRYREFKGYVLLMTWCRSSRWLPIVCFFFFGFCCCCHIG